MDHFGDAANIGLVVPALFLFGLRKLTKGIEPIPQELQIDLLPGAKNSRQLHFDRKLLLHYQNNIHHRFQSLLAGLAGLDG